MTRFPIPAVNRYGTAARQCYDKYCYQTKKQVKHYARLQNRDYYECQLCGGYHLKTKRP